MERFGGFGALNLRVGLGACNPPKNQKSQQLVPAGKVFGLLGFCFSFLPLRSTRCPDWFSGEENTAPCALCSRNLEINLAYGLGSQTRLSLLLHLHPSQ